MKKPSLLLIEDNRDTLVVFKKMLQDEYTLKACDNAIDAEREIRYTRYDLILTDINLGHGASGEDLTDLAKLTDKNGQTPVVAITAYVEGTKDIDRKKFAGFIIKPILQADLLKQLKKALNLG